MEAVARMSEAKCGEGYPDIAALIRATVLTVLLPLDRARRLGGDVVHDPIDPLHFVDDAGRDVGDEFHVEWIEIRRHAVRRRDSAQTHHIIVGSIIAHDPDRAHRKEERERLPDVVVEPRAPDLLNE